MVTVLNQSPSVINHFLYELRNKDIQKDRSKFRNNLKRLGQVMAYEVSKTFDFEEFDFKTPLDSTSSDLIKEPPVLVTILRASIPFFEGVLDYFDQSNVSFIGASRSEGDQVSINFDYMASSSIEGKTVIIIDPMLATGKSIIETYNHLIKNGLPSKVHLVAAVAAPEGIEYIAKHLKIDHHIWTAALDERLNEKAYIVPGLGDAGDLCFGEKL